LLTVVPIKQPEKKTASSAKRKRERDGRVEALTSGGNDSIVDTQPSHPRSLDSGMSICDSDRSSSGSRIEKTKLLVSRGLRTRESKGRKVESELVDFSKAYFQSLKGERFQQLTVASKVPFEFQARPWIESP